RAGSPHPRSLTCVARREAGFPPQLCSARPTTGGRMAVLLMRPLELDARSGGELYARFVPSDHPLRRMDAAVDFSFVLPLVADRYHPWIGRPAEHPERMWRLLFAQYYLNLSDRRVCLAAHESLALRWFLRLNADESPPHPTTLQKFRFRRLDEGVYLRIHF